MAFCDGSTVRVSAMATLVIAIYSTLVLLAVMLRSTLFAGAGPGTPVAGGVATIGRVLFTDYLFPFEVTSVLLLVALVGVIALAKRRVA